MPGPRSNRQSRAPPITGTTTSIRSSGAGADAITRHVASAAPPAQMSPSFSGCTTKAPFSVIHEHEPVGDEEDTGCGQQCIDDARQPIASPIEALVGEEP